VSSSAVLPDRPSNLDRHRRLSSPLWARLAGFPVAAAAAWTIYVERATVAEGFRSLKHLTPAWVAAAAVAQVASMVAFALQQQRLFRLG
jgi:hypothetical protein